MILKRDEKSFPEQIKEMPIKTVSQKISSFSLVSKLAFCDSDSKE